MVFACKARAIAVSETSLLDPIIDEIDHLAPEPIKSFVVEGLLQDSGRYGPQVPWSFPIPSRPIGFGGRRGEHKVRFPLVLHSRSLDGSYVQRCRARFGVERREEAVAHR